MTIPRNLGNLAQGADSNGVLGPTKGGTGLTSVGNNGQVLQSNGTALVFASPSAPTSVANLSGGQASQIPYQSSANTTAFIANGSSGQFLKSNGTSAPSWDAAPQGITATTGSAPYYGARAFVRFNQDVFGGSTTVNNSLNVSSMTWQSSGFFIMNFATAMPDANYSACGMATTGSSNTPVTICVDQNNAPTSSSLTCKLSVQGGFNPVGTYSSVIVFR